MCMHESSTHVYMCTLTHTRMTCIHDVTRHDIHVYTPRHAPLHTCTRTYTHVDTYTQSHERIRTCAHDITPTHTHRCA